MTGYSEDLAYIHDVGFGEFARNASVGLLETLRQKGIDDGLAVDLGCGPGQWPQALANAGYDVWGVDISPAMIERAQQRLPQADFVCDSFFEVELPECSAVTALGECFNYLLDQSNSLERLRYLFGRVYRVLQPGGAFIFDIATPGRATGGGLQHWVGDDWALLVDYDEDVGQHVLRRAITCFRQINEYYRRSEETHYLKLYEKAQVARMLREAGFRVQPMHGYGRFQFPASWAGFTAEKPR